MLTTSKVTVESVSVNYFVPVLMNVLERELLDQLRLIRSHLLPLVDQTCPNHNFNINW